MSPAAHTKKLTRSDTSHTNPRGRYKGINAVQGDTVTLVLCAAAAMCTLASVMP
jgi:hypothetical protein